METDTAAVRQVVFWNRIWLGLLLLWGAVWGARWLFTQADFYISSLHVTWSSNGLELRPGRDGSFVVTHLVLDFPEERDNNRRVVAPLPSPLAIIDSDGASIPMAEFNKLAWRDVHGNLALPPPKGAPVRAFYYSPLRTPPAVQ